MTSIKAKPATLFDHDDAYRRALAGFLEERQALEAQGLTRAAAHALILDRSLERAIADLQKLQRRNARQGG